MIAQVLESEESREHLLGLLVIARYAYFEYELLDHMDVLQVPIEDPG